uniref:Uncharacterized protein n=1 Tax=Rhizophora mucronata TaxID=61149 RepID=A0A2P2N8X4_RHIMU
MKSPADSQRHWNLIQEEYVIDMAICFPSQNLINQRPFILLLYKWQRRILKLSGEQVTATVPSTGRESQS